MKNPFLLLTFLFFFNNSFSQSELNFIFQKNGTSITSAENIFSSYQIVKDLEDRLLGKLMAKVDSLSSQKLASLTRAMKFLLLDFPLVSVGNVLQHEFGHLYRMKETGYKRSSIDIDLPFPYGRGGGFTRFGPLDPKLRVGQSEKILLRSSGMEANFILSSKIKDTWLQRGYLNSAESLFYLYNFHNSSLYILSYDEETASSGNDVKQYLKTLNQHHGITNQFNYELTASQLKKRVALNFLNTYQLFAFYNIFASKGDFFLQGIAMNKFNWIPSIYFGLNPFGPEFIIENVFYNSERIINTNIRIGENIFERNFGLGISYQSNISNNLNLTMKTDLWNQPSLELGGEALRATKKGIGGRILSEISYKNYSKLPLGVYCQIGYKTTGHIAGEFLDKQFILRLGLSIDQSYWK